MRSHHLLGLALISLAISAQAADPTHFKLSKLLEEDSVKELRDSNIGLYWGSQPTPDFPEVARPDDYTRSSISLSPFGGSARHCVEAFEKALKAMLDDARTRGYDAIVNMRAAQSGTASDDPTELVCKPGYKTTEVSLTGSFAMTSGALTRAAEVDEYAASLPPRPPAEGAIFLPLEPILTSAQAKDALGPDIGAHWGSASAPAYSQRYGPDEYSGEADVRKLGNEGACKQAALDALNAMVADAKQRKFDSIIKIRSFLDKQFAPIPTDVECQLDKKTASVTLQASLASKK